MSTQQEQIIREKHLMIPAILLRAGVDAWVIVTREDSDPILPLVLGDHLGMDTAMIFTPKGSTALLGHISMSAGHDRWFDRAVAYTPGKLEDQLVPLLKELNPKTIALNYSESDHTADGLSYGFYRRLQAALGSWLLERQVSAQDIVAELRGIKSASEVELISSAAHITVALASTIGPCLQPGITHGQLKELFKRVVSDDGRAEPEFFIPTSGCPGKILRGMDNYRVEAGDSLILDMGVRYEGYTSDYKRMWYFLRPGETDAPADLKRGFGTVRDIISDSAVNLQAGLKGYEVDQRAQSSMTQAGYDEFQSALGHQVGMAVHDGGATLGRKERYRGASLEIRPNMVFTLEPGIKMAQHYPVGIEEMCVVQRSGPATFFVPAQTEVWTVKAPE